MDLKNVFIKIAGEKKYVNTKDLLNNDVIRHVTLLTERLIRSEEIHTVLVIHKRDTKKTTLQLLEKPNKKHH